ncbi:hypothetical protein [Coleofasciculus sp. FACHB-129]|uniref:hypothetical protein n=1 Tax=Cyanophyceae TaxID=3028117 RepID=UPI0016881DCD|nr:hypothetical protein [Coleofasciculus sp. FACHB-129]MBD1894136.1 hypothetical protein [Coleofasciculus sp. FACHB-129]
MRFPHVAVCTLAAFVAGGMTAQASESPSSEGSPQAAVTDEGSVATPMVTPRSMAAIAAPEIQPEPRLASRQEFARSPSQNAPGFAARQLPALTAAPQTDLQEIPETAALPSNNLLSQLSRASDINQSASEESGRKASDLASFRNGETVNEAAVNERTIPSGGVFTSKAEALRPDEAIANSSTVQTSQSMATEPKARNTCASQRIKNVKSLDNATYQVAQEVSTPATERCPGPEPVAPLALPAPIEEFEASPALSIYIPVGYGADRNTAFISGTYQPNVREDSGSVGAAGIGIGLGNADKAVGVELSYALATNDSFGEGGFNGKLHRRFGGDVSAALGWNGFLNIGHNDFEQSKYGVVTKVFRTRESLNDAFSRVAFTVGVGDGQFRSNGAVDAGENNINVFGNLAVRVVRPVSLIAEWTGQDLALGLSIAPFKNFPFVITPALRDVAGAGDGSRFVLGVGTALKF